MCQICDDVPLRNADFSMLWTVANNVDNLRMGEGRQIERSSLLIEALCNTPSFKEMNPKV